MSTPVPDRLDRVLAELVELEPIFHHPELGSTRRDFEAMTVEDFWEVGASGRRYEREFIWTTLEQRYAAGEDDEWQADEFECRDLGSATYLLTYLLRQPGRTTRRVTVWRRTAAGWQAVYHQGTVVPAG